MHISIVFDKSGDEIKFVPINHEIAEYYINELNRLNCNRFSPINPDWVTVSIKDLQNSISSVKEFVYDLIGQNIQSYSDEEYIHQDILNNLHCWWVNSQEISIDVIQLKNSNNPKTVDYAYKIFHQSDDDQMTPSLGTVLTKLGLDLKYSNINKCLHKVENTISSVKFSTDNWIKIPNQFDKSFITNDRYNLCLPFNHLGRTLYEKYINFDSNLEFDDENTFDQLLGHVEIKLQRTETFGYSKEFIKWCSERGRTPCGESLNIGYLPELADKLYQYRLILYRNIQQQNKFSLQITT